MRKKISRKERLLALSLAFVMVFTSLSSSFAMALSGEVSSATQAEVLSGSINWGFTLKDENGKTYTATCMEPHNQSIPAKGNKVNLITFKRSSTQAWIAYLGKSRHTGMSVKEVAALSGYDDPHFFSKLFKKHIGLSPSEYRK